MADAVIYVIAAAGVVGGTWDLMTARRWWSAKPDDEPPASLRWFQGSWAHLQRTRLSGDLFIVGFCLGSGIAIWSQGEPRALRLGILAVTGLVLVTDLAVLFYNRPKFLVPPAFRSEAGLAGVRPGPTAPLRYRGRPRRPGG